MIALIFQGWYDGHSTLIAEIMIYTMLGFSLQIVLRAGVFSVAGVGFFTVGAYTTGILSIHKVPVFPAILLSAVEACIVGYFLAIVLLRLSGHYLAIATIAFDLVVTVVAGNGGSLTGGSIGLVDIPGTIGVAYIFVALVLLAGVMVLVERRQVGRTIMAVAHDQSVASVLGIGSLSVKRTVFVFAAVMGAVAGSCYALLFSAVTPTEAGFSLVITILTIVVIGGIMSWFGTVIGGILVTSLPFWLAFLGKWAQVGYGGLLLICILWAPTGILGEARKIKLPIGAPSVSPLRLFRRPRPTRPSDTANQAMSASGLLLDEVDVAQPVPSNVIDP